MYNTLFRYLFMHGCQLLFDDAKMQYCVQSGLPLRLGFASASGIE
jgi:hypothetical protein